MWKGLVLKYETVVEKLKAGGRFIDRASKAKDLDAEARIWLQERQEYMAKYLAAKQNLEIGTTEFTALKAQMQMMKDHIARLEQGNVASGQPTSQTSVMEETQRTEGRTGEYSGGAEATAQLARSGGAISPPLVADEEFDQQSERWLELIYNPNTEVAEVLHRCEDGAIRPDYVEMLYDQAKLGYAKVKESRVETADLIKQLRKARSDICILQDKVDSQRTMHLMQEQGHLAHMDMLKGTVATWEGLHASSESMADGLRKEVMATRSLLNDALQRNNQQENMNQQTRAANRDGREFGAPSGRRGGLQEREVHYEDTPGSTEQARGGFEPRSSSTPMPEETIMEGMNPRYHDMSERDQTHALMMDVQHLTAFAHIEPPKFSGEAKGRKFGVWKEDFENHCMLQKMTYNRGKLAILRRALEGVALLTYDCLQASVRNDYVLLMKQLESRFADKYDRWQAVNELLFTVQGPKEGVYEYATKLERVSNELKALCGSVEDLHDILLATVFSRGVKQSLFEKTKPNSKKGFMERVELGRRAEADEAVSFEFRESKQGQGFGDKRDRGGDRRQQGTFGQGASSGGRNNQGNQQNRPVQGGSGQGSGYGGYGPKPMPKSLVGTPKHFVQNVVDKAANPGAYPCWFCQERTGGTVYHIHKLDCKAPGRLDFVRPRGDQTGSGGYDTRGAQPQGNQNASAMTKERSFLDRMVSGNIGNAVAQEEGPPVYRVPIITVKFGKESHMVEMKDVRIDSGADFSVICMKDMQRVLKALGDDIDHNTCCKAENFTMSSADTSSMKIEGSVKMRISYGGFSTEHKFYVMENVSHAMLLGSDLVEPLGTYRNLLKEYPELLGPKLQVDRTALTLARQLCFHLGGKMNRYQEENGEVINQKGVEKEKMVNQSEGEAMSEHVVPELEEEMELEEKVLGSLNCIVLQPIRIWSKQGRGVLCKLGEMGRPKQQQVPMVFKPNWEVLATMGATCPAETLIQPNKNGNFRVPVRNMDGEKLLRLETGTELGILEQVEKLVWESDEIEEQKSGGPRAKVNGMERREQRASLNLMQQSGSPDLPPREDRRRFDDRFPLGSAERSEEVLKQVDLSKLAEDSEERELIEPWLCANADLFTLSDDEHGQCDLVHHKVDTGDSSPIRIPPRRTPLAMRLEVEGEIKRMLQLKVIQPSSSSWASPVVLIRKKTGELRFAIDFRAVNQVTKQAAAILPRIDDLLDDFAGCKIYSALDMSRGFWQLPMDPETADRTGFSSCAGHFQFNCLPFGLVNAPQQFSQVVDIVFGGLNTTKDHFAHWYIDDLAISSKSLEQHIEHLNRVAQRLRWSGLMLKPSKAQFMVKEVEYLGHLVNKDGVRPLPKKLVALQDFPVPTSATEIKRFLGMCSFYRKWVPGFSTVAGPMIALLKKGTEFIWEEYGQTGLAFGALKKALLSPPVLAFPDVNRPWVIETDASMVGCGALLHQPDENGDMHLIACASKTFDSAERNYGITERETLAIVWALKFFRPWIYGSGNITVFTDHSAAGSMLQGKGDISPKHHRWLDVVADFAPKIFYKKGSLNEGADCLSRAPLGIRDAQPPTNKPDISHLFQYDPLVEGEWTKRRVKALNSVVGASSEGEEEGIEQMGTVDMERASNVRRRQLLDPVWKEVIEKMEGGSEPKDIGSIYWTSMEQKWNFCILDGVLYRVDEEGSPSGLRVVVPDQEKQPLWEQVHAGTFGGHLGEKRIFGALKRDFWWPNMRADVVKWTKNCFRCAKNYPGHRVVPPMMPIPIGDAWETICSDVLTLPLTESGRKHVIVFQDMFTKYAMVFPIVTYDAETTAKAFTKWCTTFQPPVQFLSDGGPNYTSELFRRVAGAMGTKLLVTRPQHSKANGMAERFNKVLIAMLSRYADTVTKWDEYVDFVTFAYNITPHASTNYSPFEMCFGHLPRLPASGALQRPRLITDCDVDEYQVELIANLSEIWRIAHRYIEIAQERQKKYFDKKTKIPKYVVGGKVFLLRRELARGPNHKLLSVWEGPYLITELPNNNNAKIVLCSDKVKRTEQEVAIENLAPCHLEDLRQGEGSQSYQQRQRKKKEAIQPIRRAEPTHSYGTRARTRAMGQGIATLVAEKGENSGALVQVCSSIKPIPAFGNRLQSVNRESSQVQRFKGGAEGAQRQGLGQRPERMDDLDYWFWLDYQRKMTENGIQGRSMSRMEAEDVDPEWDEMAWNMAI